MKSLSMVIILALLLFAGPFLSAQTSTGESPDSSQTESAPGPTAPQAPEAPVPPSVPGESGEVGEVEETPLPEAQESPEPIPEDEQSGELGSGNGSTVSPDGTPETATGTTDTGTSGQQEQPDQKTLLRAGRFIETPLLVRQNQGRFRDSGEIRDIVITDQGEITYYLASLRNVEGYGSGLYLIGADGIVAENGTARLDLSNQPPEMVLVRDEKLISQHYGQNAMLVTRLVRFNVLGTDQRKLGTFEDVVFDAESRTVSYIVLVDSGFLGLGRRYHAVPFTDIDYDTRTEAARIAVTSDQLGRMRGFDNEYWPMEPGIEWEGVAPPVEQDAPAPQAVPPETTVPETSSPST